MRRLVSQILQSSILIGMLLVLAASAQAARALIIDADAQLEYAKSLLKRGENDAAAAELDRFIHFFPDDPRVPQARFDQATAHFKAGRYNEAENRFRHLANETDRDDALAAEAFFMLSRCHARQGQREQSVLDLHNLMMVSDDADTLDRARYEIGWLYVDQARWERAGGAFDAISEPNRQRMGIPALSASLSQSDAISRRDPTTAGVLSIIPGGGQLYCGRYQDALAAFLINTGLIWASWEAFDKDQPALGSVLGFVEFGFYAGNIYGAISGAHKYNRDENARFRDRLYQNRKAWLSLAPRPGGAGVSLSVRF